MGEKKKEKTSQHVHIVKSLLEVNSRICFLLAQKKAAKKIAAVKKTPKPSFAERLRKTNLKLYDPSKLNVFESRFSQKLNCELGLPRHFFQGRGIQIHVSSKRESAFFLAFRPWKNGGSKSEFAISFQQKTWNKL